MEKVVVGVKFRDSGKVFYFEPKDIELKKGDSVIVHTNNGEEFGNVVLDPRNVPEEKIKELFPIIRKATPEDIEYRESLLKLGDEAKEIFYREAVNHDLAMKLIDVTYTFDMKKVIFYYTADGRVDFRDLVRDLAGHFHSRIELRQIGVRDEARKYGGIGVCGRKCCCSSWLTDFIPVSIKMAKEQNLSLNSTKISGVCGRLLCCLKYEQDYYEEVSKKMPRIGDELKTPAGVGTVYKLNTLDQAVLMKIVNDRDETEIKRYTLEELEKAKNEPEAKEPESFLNYSVFDETDSPKQRQKNPRRRRRPRRRPTGAKTENQRNAKKNSGSNNTQKQDKAQESKPKTSKPARQQKKNKKPKTGSYSKKKYSNTNNKQSSTSRKRPKPARRRKTKRRAKST